MDIKPIRNDGDYRAALKQIEPLMTAEADSPEGERLDVLTTLVEAYKQKRFPLELPEPVEAIKFRMEQMGLTPKDLEPMIRKLHDGLGIPAESLIKHASEANTL